MNLDMNQLKLFKLIYETQSLTEAAKRFPLSLSSACRMLKQMREELNDDLFTRYGYRLMPTAMSCEMKPKIDDLYDRLCMLADRSHAPHKLKRIFTVAGLDHDLFVYIFPMLAELKKTAPDVQINFLQLRHNFYNDLRSGRCDFVIYPTDQDFGGFVREFLSQDRLVYVALQNSSFAQRQLRGESISEAELMKHVRVQPTIPFFNSENTRMGLFHEDVEHSAYHPQVWSPFAILTALSLHDDNVTFMPYKTARLLKKTLPLTVIGSPADIAPYRSCLIWSALRKNDPGFIWLRSFILSINQKTSFPLDEIPVVRASEEYNGARKPGSHW